MPAPSAGRDEAVGGALVAASAVLFGTIVVLGRFLAASTLPAQAMLAMRFGICAVLLATMLVVLRRPLLPEPGERVGHVVVGAAGYAVEASFFFASLRHGNAAPATLLFYTYPVFVTLASWAIGRGRPTRLTLITLVLGISGAAVIVAGGNALSIEPLGVVFALCSASMYTVYLLGAAHVIRRTAPLTSSLWVSASASAGLVVSAAVTGRLEMPSGWEQWWPILGMAAATAGAFVTLFGGLRRLGPVRTAIISAAEPFAAALLALVFLSEPIGPGVVLGGALIVAAAVITSIARPAPIVEPPIP
jgi:drug/metabolite transporter (DMT)-like permease